MVVLDMSQAGFLNTKVDDDSDLMMRIGQGDREAFHNLYQRWAGRLLSILLRQYGSQSEAEDLLQDVFLTVWRKASSYHASRGDVGGWLYTVCRHRAIDRFRRGRPTEDLERVAEPSTPACRTPELRVDLEQALGTLEHRERIAVQLAYFGGFTYEETAHRLDVPVGTLKSRIRNGLRKMAKELSTRPSLQHEHPLR